MSISQPVPKVSRRDVERVARRDFPRDDTAAILAILDAYGIEKYEQGQARVQLAALKNANGNIDILRQQIETAKLDYRDVLSVAEYPEYMRLYDEDDIPPEEEKKIINSDWSQYCEWLNRL